MFSYIEKRFALSNKGAKDFAKGVFFTILQNIALMFPVVFVFIFIGEYIRPVLYPGETVVHGIWYFILLALGLMLIMWIIALLQYRSNYTKIFHESANRRISLAEKLRKLPLSFFGEKNLSDLTATIMSDCTDLEHIFSHAVPQLFASAISIVFISIGLFFYNWQLALALLWVVPIALAIILISKNLQSRSNQYMYQSKRDVSEHIQEGLDTIQEIKAYNLENTYMDALAKKLNTYELHLTKGELSIGAIVNSAQSILKLGLVSVIVVGGNLLATGSVDLFTYLLFLLISSRIYAPVGDVFNSLAGLFMLDIRIKRMNEMEALPTQQGQTRFNPDNYNIEFKNVCFSYEIGKQVINNVSFIAKQGEITALVGSSGGGKSTLAKLAARFWDIDSGKILLDGHDISTIDPEALLNYYSVVFQDVVLFNTTIMDNIRIGKRDATDEEVIRIAKLAQCDDFIQEMPDGYQTVIGENGETLSGGERQRISIARALLKNAPIVLLDEATASLDVENETKIQASISELIRNKTVLIIAHRMRTVANADKIIVLNNGMVAESGSSKELKAQNGIFAKMLERQMNLG